MRSEPLSEDGPLTEVAADVEAGHGPIALVRPGHTPVVLVSAEEWEHLHELESAEATAWWRRDAAERASRGETPDESTDTPGIDEAEFRRRFAHLLPGSTGAA
jgi:PHD/YefM family antitoxin component YafN of YafNO toxin-antitoxin module